VLSKSPQLGQLVSESEIVDLLQRLIRVDSSNPPGQEEPVALLMAEVLGGAGLEVTVDRFQPGRANVVARWRGEGRKPALLLSGHLDAVPAGRAEWKYPSHGGVVKDGVLYGRGAVDMKGALAAMAAALLAFSRTGVPLAGDVVFAGTAGEEVDSAGARRLITQEIGAVGELVVGEPTGLQLASAHKGALWLEIETFGKAAHGSMPDQGRNAILAMMEVMGHLNGFRSDTAPHPLLGRPTLNVGSIHGGNQPNVVPDHCAIRVDVRTLPCDSHEVITEELRQRLGIPSIRQLNSMAAVETPSDAPLIQSAMQLAAGVDGGRPKLRGMTYYSDASVLAQALGVPALICGPGDERLAHQTDEHVALEDVFAAARFYFELARLRLA
jgi:succinyl-diaminopimelate desuccinylase